MSLKRYFSAEYDVRFEGAALSDFNAQQDATAQKIQETADAVRASGAVAIFAENSNNSKSVEKVASLAGVRAIIGDEALYGDSLGEPGSDGQTYIGFILHNASKTVSTICCEFEVCRIKRADTTLQPKEKVF